MFGVCVQMDEVFAKEFGRFSVDCLICKLLVGISPFEGTSLFFIVTSHLLEGRTMAFLVECVDIFESNIASLALTCPGFWSINLDL